MVFLYCACIKFFEAGSNNYAAHIKGNLLRFLIQIDSACWTNRNTFGAVIEFAGVLVDGVDLWVNSRNVDVDGFSVRQVCVVGVRSFNWTNRDTFVAGYTFVCVNITGLLFDSNFVVSRNAFNSHNRRVCQYIQVRNLAETRTVHTLSGSVSNCLHVR